ncbi:MAG: hypothetical protein ACTSRU_10060 [Candidatus Hodarchaeales archaeon]
MDILISEIAEEDLDDMDKSLRDLFFQHVEKLLDRPPRKSVSLSPGRFYSVKKVTRSARMIYYREESTIYILHCFKNHKEYEKWYKSYK